MNSTILKFALAIAALQPVAAQAQTFDVRSTRSVRIDDLDLASDSGRHTLAIRLAAAVRQVCGVPDNRDLPAMAEHMRCRASARAQAARQARLAIATRGQKLAQAVPGEH